MNVPLALVVVFISLVGSGFLTWVAFTSKALLEHARIMAVLRSEVDDLREWRRGAEPVLAPLRARRDK
jgi:hypothetical protein